MIGTKLVISYKVLKHGITYFLGNYLQSRYPTSQYCKYDPMDTESWFCEKIQKNALLHRTNNYKMFFLLGSTLDSGGKHLYIPFGWEAGSSSMEQTMPDALKC